MSATGGHKTQITRAAPRFTDARPSWSPNGRHLAFVKTRRGRSQGLLTRYDTVTRRNASFSTPYRSEHPTKRQVMVAALPAPVAWGWALSADGATFATFIVLEAPARSASRTSPARDLRGASTVRSRAECR